MEKVSIAAHQNQLQRTIDALYRLKLLDVDEYEGELERGDPFEEAEEFSEMLVRTRSILSRMPEVEATEGGNFQLSNYQERLEEIGKTFEENENEVKRLESEITRLRQRKKLLKGLKGSGLEIEDLKGSKRLEVSVLEGDVDLDRIATDRYQVFRGKKYNVIVYDNQEANQIERAIREGKASQITVPEMEFTGSIDNALERTSSKTKKLQAELEEQREKLQQNAESWVPELRAAEKFLEEKVEKAEAPLSFATTEHAFVAKGWIPEEKFEELGEELHRVSGGKIHLQSEPADEEPPVKYENNRVVRPFESLTELVGTPRYNELDPSALIFLMFPVLFGFMIGDAGYGLTTGIVFYAGMKYIKGAREIFKSLLWASFFTVLFGLAFGDAFGYVIFGHHSELAAVTGIHLFEKIPILWHRAEHLGTVFEIAAVIGFLQVNLGFLLGFYNEYVNHGIKEAFLEKISWIIIEIGALGWYALGPAFGVPILVIGVVALGVGDGIEGIVEIPSLISNILSYLRIFGVAVAAVALAAVVNAMAEPLYAMGGIKGLVLGTLVLAVGHGFNTGIKIMEGFLQGIRLQYVEFFTKFFEGGGRRYVPFGART